jgi:hypothetical protein
MKGAEDAEDVQSRPVHMQACGFARAAGGAVPYRIDVTRMADGAITPQ